MGSPPVGLPGDAKEGLLKLVDDAVASGCAHHRACGILGVADVRVRRWRARRRDVGTLGGSGPGRRGRKIGCSTGVEAILALIEEGARRLLASQAHRSSWLGRCSSLPRRCVASPRTSGHAARTGPAQPFGAGSVAGIGCAGSRTASGYVGRHPLHPGPAQRLRHRRRRQPILVETDICVAESYT